MLRLAVSEYYASLQQYSASLLADTFIWPTTTKSQRIHINISLCSSSRMHFFYSLLISTLTSDSESFEERSFTDANAQTSSVSQRRVHVCKTKIIHHIYIACKNISKNWDFNPQLLSYILFFFCDPNTIISPSSCVFSRESSHRTFFSHCYCQPREV